MSSSSYQKVQWKLVKLTSQNGFKHIRHLGHILGTSALRMDIWYRIWNLVLFLASMYDIGNIDANFCSISHKMSTRVQGDDPA